MSPSGQLKVQFTKEIEPLPFLVSSEKVRQLKKQITSIEDAVTLEIEGAKDELEIDKSIAQI